MRYTRARNAHPKQYQARTVTGVAAARLILALLALVLVAGCGGGSVAPTPIRTDDPVVVGGEVGGEVEQTEFMEPPPAAPGSWGQP